MARLLGPDAGSRTQYLPTSPPTSAWGRTALVYSDAAGTQLADIATYNANTPTTPGAAVSGSALVVDQTSQLPQFWLPDGADTVWVALDGVLRKVNADEDARLDAGPLLTRSTAPSAGVLAALYRGYTTVVQLVGDSTGDAVTEWFGLLGQKIGAAFPAYNVLYRPWNATNQWYDLPTSLQAGPSGDSKVTTSGSCSLQYAGNNIATDLDVRVRINPTSWASGGLQVVAGKWNSTGNQRSWWFGITSGGLLCLTWSADGTSTQVQKFSTVATGIANGTTKWIRATLDVDNGASGNDLKFYTSTDGATWTQLGATVTTAGTTSVFASTAAYQLCALDSSFGSTYAGETYWVEVRDGIGATAISLVPPLPDTWDQASLSTTNTVLVGGSPTLLFVNGSEGGQNIAYWDDATRRTHVLSPHAQSLLMLSSGHNETYVTTGVWVTTLAGWVANAKTLLPGVPIALLTQNPAKSPVVQNERDVRARRGIALMTWARSQAGVYGMDTYPAFDAVASQVGSDGTHPSTTGEQVWRDHVYRALFAL